MAKCFCLGANVTENNLLGGQRKLPYSGSKLAFAKPCNFDHILLECRKKPKLGITLNPVRVGFHLFLCALYVKGSSNVTIELLNIVTSHQNLQQKSLNCNPNPTPQQKKNGKSGSATNPTRELRKQLNYHRQTHKEVIALSNCFPERKEGIITMFYKVQLQDFQYSIR